jgi:hypothetical protein
MSDSVEKTAAGATRGLLGSYSFILVMLGLEMWTSEHATQFGLGLFLLIIGGLLAYAAFFWETAKKVLSIEAQTALGSFAQGRATWAFVIFIILQGFIVAPFVEKQRWPFSTVFHDPPTAEEVKKAAAPRIEAAKIDASNQIANSKAETAAQIAKLQSELTRMTAKVEAPIWRDIESQLHQLDVDVLRTCDNLLANWKDWVSSSPTSISNLASIAINRGGSISIVSAYLDRFDAWRRANSEYPDVVKAMDTSSLQRLSGKLSELYRQVLIVPKDESSLNSIMADIGDAVREVRTWQTTTLAKASEKIEAAK